MATIDVLLAGLSARTDQATLGLGAALLVRGQNNILVDTGHHGRRQLLGQALESHGLTPDDIHTVVLTHAHWDHVQNVDMFPKARFIIHPAELEYARSPNKSDWATAGYFAATLTGLDVHEVVEGAELEPGIKIVETPGHTRGAISLAVDTPDGTALIASDAFPDAGTINRGRPYLVFWDENESRESLRKMMGISSIIYPGHDRPFRIGADGSTQYLEGVTSLTVTVGFEEADSGVGVTIALEPIRQLWNIPQA
ncbi:MAG: MBL fold metallo-hydrolase [Dehalococcoidia bacterium]